jgi:hypothetical protein
MPVLPGPARSMLPVPVPPVTPSSLRHRSFSALDRELQRLAVAPLVPGVALPEPMLEPGTGAEPMPELSGATLPAPGVLLPVVSSAAPLLAPALEFDVPLAPVLSNAPLEDWANAAEDRPSIAAAAAAPSSFMFMSWLLKKSAD